MRRWSHRLSVHSSQQQQQQPLLLLLLRRICALLHPLRPAQQQQV
jgi:hypothetical protein